MGEWLSWRSPLWPVWLWHATFDGTQLCCCAHSAEYRAAGAPRAVPRDWLAVGILAAAIVWLIIWLITT